MVVLSDLEQSVAVARERVRKLHESGEALECFRKNVEAQGGDPRVCDEPRRILPLTEDSFKVESPRSGFITKVDTQEIGHAIAEAGGGRVRVDDQIDPTVGFLGTIKIGDEVAAGDLIGTVWCRDSGRGEQASARIQAAYEVSEDPFADLPELIKEVIK